MIGEKFLIPGYNPLEQRSNGGKTLREPAGHMAFVIRSRKQRMFQRSPFLQDPSPRDGAAHRGQLLLQQLTQDSLHRLQANQIYTILQ